MQELKRREDAIARSTQQSISSSYTSLGLLSDANLFLAAGIVIEEKNWPDFFPLIHHDITNEIPIHLQKIQYVAFATLLGNAKSTLESRQKLTD